MVTPAQRSALTVRDRGCVFPACDRPLAWCDAHHLVSWLDGGLTNLANLALVGRAHHRAVHEGAGGWPAAPMAGSAPPHRSEHTGVPPDGTRQGSIPSHHARRVHGARTTSTTVPGGWTGPDPPQQPPSQVRAWRPNTPGHPARHQHGARSSQVPRAGRAHEANVPDPPPSTQGLAVAVLSQAR